MPEFEIEANLTFAEKIALCADVFDIFTVATATATATALAASGVFGVPLDPAGVNFIEAMWEVWDEETRGVFGGGLTNN